MLIVSVLANIAMKIGAPDMAFVIRIWIVFLACLAVGFVVSSAPPPAASQVVDTQGISFDSAPVFNRLAISVAVLLTLIYVVFW